MTFLLNEYDVEDAANLFTSGKYGQPAANASLALYRLVEWTNGNSDGWPYWRKPANASASLQRLVRRACEEVRQTGETGITAADVRKALAPVKAFLTRQGAHLNLGPGDAAAGGSR